MCFCFSHKISCQIFIIYFEVLFSSFKTFMISPSPTPATITIKMISAISRAVIFYSR
ncbi:hypothetical protein UNSW2_467 [Campylobacter concisus UNSW2]|uniref:Uncharacterized protein n=1 Tax=Campylobacter concisus UNSW2 TaxID=1242965 RepID=U2GVP5_9BACT|nr:hypothetical protein UNSW2_467 [Campylobacter concisus UNSW2]